MRPALIIGYRAVTLRACRSLGIPTVTVVGAPQRDWGDLDETLLDEHVVVDDHHNVESVVSGLLRAGLLDDRYQAVYTADEFSLVEAAALAEVLHARGLGVPTAVAFRDKYVQKTLVRDAGFPTAEIELIPDLADPPAGLEERFSFPAVLKPVAGGGTMSTTLVDRREALADAIAAARETASTWRTFLLESFNRGQEWNIDGFVADGELGLLAVEAYRDNCLRTIKSGALIGSILFDPVREAWVYEVARPYVSAVLEALGLRHGIFHMEAFWDGAGLTFGECAARIAGGFHSEVVAHKYGVDLPTVAVQLAYGLDPPTERDPVIDDAVGFTFLPTVPGTLESCPSPEELAQLANVVSAVLEVSPGSVMSDMSSTTIARAGLALVAAEDEPTLERRMDEVAEWFRERVVVRDAPAPQAAA